MGKLVSYLLGERGPTLRNTKNQRVLKFLRREYLCESLMAARLRQGVQDMHYPQFRERLRQIALEEQKHAEWFREKIVAAGGIPPEMPSADFTAKNSWEWLVRSLKEERRCGDDLIEGMVEVGELDRGTVEGLRAMRKQESRHRDAIQSMLMRSDAYAFWPE